MKSSYKRRRPSSFGTILFLVLAASYMDGLQIQSFSVTRSVRTSFSSKGLMATNREISDPTPRAGRNVRSLRIFGLEVHPDDLQNDDSKRDRTSSNDVQQEFVHPAVLTALTKRLKTSDFSNVRVVRRSLDARQKNRPDGSRGPRFVFVLDVDTKARVKEQPGRTELAPSVSPILSWNVQRKNLSKNKRVIIVGAGPAGLFSALVLANQGLKPVVLERGQPVESRGRDIGALMHRRSLNAESNFCFGEGGAGTWSDGKLTTRIGRNSDAVRFVLETLVKFGAPANILLEGAPHLGTDNLVRLLRNMRSHLRSLGGEIHFGTKVNDFIIKNGAVVGVVCEKKTLDERKTDGAVGESHENRELFGDVVILATGHSARDVYERLHEAGVRLEPKGFAVGFRVEHPQGLINKIQYGEEWGRTVVTGKPKTDRANQEYFEKNDTSHNATLPVPSYRLATDKALNRGVYSFCMCPGGQIVPASTDPNEICVNGMSFSRRDSLWANSALVVTVSPDDPILDSYRETFGPLAGVAFQREMERRAAVMGGGNLTVPVQRLTDFIEGRASISAPSSSYRLGVKPAACHEIYPAALTASLKHAIVEHFDKQMPGYVCEEGLLHAVETRTSSPVRIARDEHDLNAIGINNLFPAGEGAGFAGGIVSAAVDGVAVADAVLNFLSSSTTTRDKLTYQSRSDSLY